MHLSLEELLEYRDGERTPGSAIHVASCPECAAEVERLREVAAALKALPVERPARDRWPAVQAAVTAQRRRRRVIAGGGVALALAASIVLLIVAPREIPRSGKGAPVAGTARPQQEDVASLVRESQRLEEVLRAMHPDDRAVDFAEASRVADLQDRISLVDARLARPDAGALTHMQAKVLWKERVGLMNALVQANDTRPAYVGL